MTLFDVVGRPVLRHADDQANGLNLALFGGFGDTAGLKEVLDNRMRGELGQGDFTLDELYQAVVYSEGGFVPYFLGEVGRTGGGLGVLGGGRHSDTPFSGIVPALIIIGA